MGSVLKRRLQGGDVDRPAAGLSVCSVLDPVPGLREMLVASRYPDGAPRLTSTLLLFIEDSVVKVCLNDRDQSQTAWASGACVADCLEALEAGLQGDTLQWRVGGQKKGWKGGKKS